MNPPVSKPIPSEGDVEGEGEDAVTVDTVGSEDIVKEGVVKDEDEGAPLGELPLGVLIESDMNRDDGVD